MRVYCTKSLKKGGITTTDIWGKRTFRKANRDGCDRSIHVCSGHAPGGYWGDNCFDPERMWCNENDCSVFECNQLWWSKKKVSLYENLEKLENILPKVLQYLEVYKNGDPEYFKDLSNYEVYCFFRELRFAFNSWNPEWPQDLDMMKYFYEQEINNEKD